MENPIEQNNYKELTGNILAPAQTWQQLDQMIQFFHRPDNNQFGGNLFRNPGYLVWEWWARFHANGGLPFNANMQATINSKAGVSALEDLVNVTSYLTPGSIANGLFENWTEFAEGNVFCNIGWGGTQKHMMSQSTMRNNVLHSALPGPLIDDKPSSMGYFNWGWSYTVSTQSTQTELAYLLALFCVTPAASTMAVKASEGFFDPFRASHYEDDGIKAVYGSSFLEAHRLSMSKAIPDLYISGQNSYLSTLRKHILQVLQGEISAQDALDECTRSWNHITRRLGQDDQSIQWQELLSTYPAALQTSEG